jgi:hypothetical protein
MHPIVQDREFAQERAPQIKGPDLTFTVTAGVLFDRFNLAFGANSFPDQGLNPVEAIEDNRIKLVLFTFRCANLSEKLADRFGLREPGDIELLGPLFGADKDGLGSVACPTTLSNSISAVDKCKDVPVLDFL